jgi:DNA-binding winged helix-turn-helix (wHTH) protein/Flp pilus assembly protein TadD
MDDESGEQNGALRARDSQRIPCGVVALDPVRRVVTHDGTQLAISSRLYDTLHYLVEHSGRVVTKDELLGAVWPNKVVEESNVSQAIFSLRKALASSGATEAIIATAPGQGYRFTGQAQWIQPDSALPAPVQPDPSASPAAPAGARWQWPVAVVAVALVAAVLIAAVAIWHNRPAVAAHNRVVLADFVNRTHDPIFDRTLDNVLRIDLGQSPCIDVVRQKEARDTLALMNMSKDTPLTVDLAREVCSRTNSHAVLNGEIDQVGAQYLVTIDATDCTGQRSLGSAKAQVSRREAVVAQLDALIAQVRGALGEPLASIDQYNIPLIPAKTGSLEALKAYSEGVWLNFHSHEAAAIKPIEHAVAIDPQFGAAWFVLAGIYNNMMQQNRADAAVVRAYALRDQLNERQRLNLEVYYEQIHNGDYLAELRTLQHGTSIYPSEWSYWTNLANVESALANYDAAAFAARRAIELKGPSELPYVALTSASMARGDQRAAHAAIALAFDRGYGGGATLHACIMDLAIIENDRSEIQRQLAWAATQPEDTTFLTDEARMYYRAGQIVKGDAAFQRIIALSGANAANDPNLGFRARLFEEMGYSRRARAMIAQARGLDDDLDFIAALAQFGDSARAARLLQRQIAQSPDMTLMRVEYAPKVQALLALRAHDPRAALAALAPALPYAARGFDIPFIQGQALLDAGEPAQAASAFRTIVDHPGWYPESPYYPLAALWLARSLRAAHDVPGARNAYDRFFGAWRDADPGMPLIQQARAERAALSSAQAH